MSTYLSNYTHRGWLLFCPVILGEIDSDAPLCAPRRFVPEVLFDLAVLLSIYVVRAFFPIVAGRLARPIPYCREE